MNDKNLNVEQFLKREREKKIDNEIAVAIGLAIGSVFILSGKIIKRVTLGTIENLKDYREVFNYKRFELYLYGLTTFTTSILGYKTILKIDNIESFFNKYKVIYENVNVNTLSLWFDRVSMMLIIGVIPISYFTLRSFIVGTKVPDKVKNKISDLYKGNVKVLKVIKNRKEGTKDYILDSEVSLDTVTQGKKEVEHILRTTIIKFKYINNKRYIQITTNKNITYNLEDIDKNNIPARISAILKNWNVDSNLITSHENDYVTVHKFNVNHSVKQIIKNKEEISNKLRIAKKYFNVEYDEKSGTTNFEIYNKEYKVYFLQDYINKVDEKMYKHMEVPVFLGVDMKTGNVVIEDLHSFPHALIMGSTDSGKSSFINSFVQSGMYLKSNIVWIMTDFKYLELNQYKNFNNVHFIQDLKEFRNMLIILETIMNYRKRKFGDIGVKKISTYNDVTGENVPYIVLLVDECADLTLDTDNKLVNEISVKLAQIINKARALGIIIIESLQRADHEQIPTKVRSQLRCKIGFGTSDKEDSSFVGFKDLTGLRIGEFMIKTKGNERKVKSFYIEDNFTKELKNKVYENLYLKHVGKEYKYYIPNKKADLEVKESEDK